LADWGRTEIKLAEAEMLGLMAFCEEYGASKPLADTRIVKTKPTTSEEGGRIFQA